MKDLPETPKPVLVMVRGLPGSGKSYLAKELQNQLGNDTIVLLDPDATDYSSEEYVSFSSDLVSQGVDAKLYPYRYLRSNAYQAILSGKIIIWNQAFTNQDLLHRTIVNLQTFASEHSVELKSLIIEVEIDHHIAKQRVAARAKQGGHDVDDETFERFINDYSSFSGYGYKTVTVNGSASLSDNAASCLDAIMNSRKS